MIHLGAIGTIIVVLVLAGLLLGLVTTYVPMAPPIKQLLVTVVVIALVFWILQVFGIFVALGIFGQIIQVLVVVGILLWLATTYIPMSPPITVQDKWLSLNVALPGVALAAQRAAQYRRTQR